jgi:predicted CoA-binding protein
MLDYTMGYQELLTPDKIYAVVGASNAPEKYGYRVYKFLKDRGLKVYPVNPNQESVQGDKAYPDLASLPEKPDIADVVTQPEVSEKVYTQAQELGIQTTWFQPGAESENLVGKPGTIANHCIMVEIENLEAENLWPNKLTQ